MKKFISILLATVFMVALQPLVFANDIEPNKPSIVMAINEETVVANGTLSTGTAPVLVFGKTYVDLYRVAPLLGATVEWIDDYIGFCRVTANQNTTDFTLIYQWEDVINHNYKFFIKDSAIFVSLRDLCELTGHPITYQAGIITIGNPSDFTPEIYGDIATYHYNDYLYTAYPSRMEHAVYPYQAYSYETMLTDAKKLQHMYPDLVKTSTIGKSVEERDLLLIEFGKGPNKIFVCGTHHAREYITTTYLMYAIDRYAYAYKNGSMWGQYSPKEILENITFYIVPMVNPDGVNLVLNGIQATKNPGEIAAMGIYEGQKYGYSAWKANVHGVDLNWNYDKDWTLEKNRNPRGSVGFNGDHPYSEPETIAVSDYVDSHSFDAYLSFHTQGKIFYYADDPENPSDINEIIKRDTGFVEYIDDGTGIGGSFFDYAYRKFKKPTITIELCPYVGNFPYPDKQFDTVWKPAKNILLIVGNEILYQKSRLAE